MRTETYIEVLRREGALMADTAEKAGPDVPVPSCPGWRTGNLLRHTGSVHRWAARTVDGALQAPPAPGENWEGYGDDPADADLVAWFREGHDRLVEVLRAAGPGLECWHFLAAPSALRFWARRQAHETTVHRVDTEAALGGPVTEVDAAFALDGVDELLAGFHTRRKSRVRSDSPTTLRVRAVDAERDGTWLVRISADPPRVERTAAGEADCTLSGTAADLYLALWNRLPLDTLEVTGNERTARLWREHSAIV